MTARMTKDQLMRELVDSRATVARMQMLEAQREKSEQALRESEAKYAALVERAHDGVAILQNGVFKFANRAAAKLLGYSVDELAGMPFLPAIAAECRDLVVRRYESRLAGEPVPLVYEVKLQRKDGSLFDVELSGGLIEYQGRPADMIVARDITERKRTEEDCPGRGVQVRQPGHGGWARVFAGRAGGHAFLADDCRRMSRSGRPEIRVTPGRQACAACLRGQSAAQRRLDVRCGDVRRGHRISGQTGRYDSGPRHHRAQAGRRGIAGKRTEGPCRPRP
ncbi:MAG: PAS domain S-box protein, partial [Chloroflexi bacterium]|nr:PAS domain S-box protein [Chloroflexota bacterium]